MVIFGVGIRKVLLGFSLVAVVAVGGVAWVERAELQAWACVRGLAKADETSRARWLERVVRQGETSVPWLIARLEGGEKAACDNCRTALQQLGAAWGVADARTADVGLQLARAYPHLSSLGRCSALELTCGWLASAGDAAPGELVGASGRMLGECAGETDASIRARALELCATVLAGPQPAEALAPCREVIRGGLQATDPATRVRAVQLTLQPGLDLMDAVVPLLQDRAAEVRRAAILAVATADTVVHEESLLPCLHDPDGEVRRLCEVALRGRGLRSEHLQLARLLTDARSTTRLEVLDHLAEVPDLDPGVWLRRMSHDPSPAVRAAAVRAMRQQTTVDLSDRIDQMAHSDPSPTVCALARYYLQCPQASAEDEP